MSATLLDAITLATRAHAGQVDKAGEPYIGHVARVACRARVALRERGVPVDQPDDELREELDRIEQVAWLHDTIEDTTMRAAPIRVGVTALEEWGYAPEVVEAVRLITRPPAWGYGRYVEQLVASENLGAVVVKLADLADNLDPARAGALTPSHRRRYVEAQRALQAAFRAVGP